MTSIDAGSARLASLLAEQLAAQLRKRAQHQTPADTHTTDTDPGVSSRTQQDTTVSADEQSQLLQTLTKAVGHLSPDDPDRQRKAYRLFMQAVLARALDRSRFDDMSFTLLLNTVLEQMEEEPQLHRQLREAGQLLLDAADTGRLSP